MIILDLNQVMISNLMMQIGNHTNAEVDENLLRHMILNSIRSYNIKYRTKYGQMVIACDDRDYWRRDVFPYYKANRKKARDKSELDWTKIFECLNTIRSELREFFPYPVIQVPRAEADDIIGCLARVYGDTERVLILSGDKDFMQLQRYFLVEQYDPVRKKFLKCDNPGMFLKEHIIRGDDGDGVPNFLSEDSCLVLGKRQKSIFQAKVDTWLNQTVEHFTTPETMANYVRNHMMIDLTNTPHEICTEILEQYKLQQSKDRSKLFGFFVEKKLRNLMDSINEF